MRIDRPDDGAPGRVLLAGMGAGMPPNNLNASKGDLNEAGGGSKGATAPQRGRRLDRSRLALIHLARRDCHLSEEEYRALLQGVAGVTTASALNLTTFRRVMERFEVLGFKQRQTVRPCTPAQAGERIGMATPAQIAYMRGLFFQWLGREDEGALVTWIESKYRVSAIRFMDVGSAQKAIEGLKKMAARRRSNDTKEH